MYPVRTFGQIGMLARQKSLSFPLRSADLSKHDRERAEDDDQVKPEGAFFNVFDVVLDPFLEIGAAAAGAFDLPQAGDPRAER